MNMHKKSLQSICVQLRHVDSDGKSTFILARLLGIGRYIRCCWRCVASAT